MKNRVITGILFIVLGGLLAFGPLYLFKVCASMGDEFMRCHWTSRAELGIGLLIAAFGILTIVIRSAQIRLGINIALAATALLAASIPTVLIGVCEMPKMNCHAVAAPSILVTSILTIFIAVSNVVYLNRHPGKSGE